MKALNLLFALSLFGLMACNGNSQTKEEMADETTEMESEEKEMEYSLTPFSKSTSYPDATMNRMSYENGTFDFDFSNYELAIQTPDAEMKMCANSDQGQHIHLIVDTQPYVAKYESSFTHEVPDGDHYILAFLSRSYHESIKNGKAAIAKKVNVSGQSITSEEVITDPMLFYSRPKGNYIGKANTEKVLLDFFLVNTELGDQYMVKAQINDEVHMLDKWQPYYIEGLPMGDNLITLTLVDKEGKKVDTPLNPVSRKFTLEADPAGEM